MTRPAAARFRTWSSNQLPVAAPSTKSPTRTTIVLTPSAAAARCRASSRARTRPSAVVGASGTDASSRAGIDAPKA